MDMEELFTAMKAGEITNADLENQRIINNTINKLKKSNGIKNTKDSESNSLNNNLFTRLTTPKEREILNKKHNMMIASQEDEEELTGDAWRDALIDFQRKNIPNMLQDKADLLFNKYKEKKAQLDSINKDIDNTKNDTNKIDSYQDKLFELEDKISELQNSGDKSLKTKLALLDYTEQKQRIQLALDSLNNDLQNSSSNKKLIAMKQVKRGLVDDLKLIKKAFDDLAQEKVGLEKDNDFYVMRNILNKRYAPGSEDLGNAITDYEDNPDKYEPEFKNNNYSHAKFDYNDYQYKDLFKSLGL